MVFRILLRASWVALLACGSGGENPDGGTDGASDGTIVDANHDAPLDGTLVDANHDASVSDAGLGDASIVGDQAFPILFAWMDPNLPHEDCGGTNQTSDGGLAATAIDLFEHDVSSIACSDGGFAGATGRVVGIGIATQEYASGKTSNLTQALTPGQYTIGNQNVPDEDFCMIPSGATALLQVLAFDDAGVAFASWNGVSGTVTITSVSNTAVAGSFVAQLGDAHGSNADGGALSGTFAAKTCP